MYPCVRIVVASDYTFAEATWTQSLPDWLGSHTRAMTCIKGVPALIVPDNLRNGVSKACRYDPDINPSYQQWAEHYQVAILPARPRKPRDKAKAEQGVLLVQRWILARLRHHRCFSLAELNRHIAGLLDDLNKRPFKRRPGCRIANQNDLLHLKQVKHLLASNQDRLTDTTEPTTPLPQDHENIRGPQQFH